MEDVIFGFFLTVGILITNAMGQATFALIFLVILADLLAGLRRRCLSWVGIAQCLGAIASILFLQFGNLDSDAGAYFVVMVIGFWLVMTLLLHLACLAGLLRSSRLDE